jgi:hypothetical protein
MPSLSRACATTGAYLKSVGVVLGRVLKAAWWSQFDAELKTTLSKAADQPFDGVDA